MNAATTPPERTPVTDADLAVIVPAKNEQETIASVVGGVLRRLPRAEVIVVDDGSDDETGARARAAGARVVRHPVSRGNGASIKSGVRHASRPLVVCMDADGQHEAAEIPRLMARYNDGYDMVVGARSTEAHASLFRRVANATYNRLATWMTGVPIADLTSGFRLARTEPFRQFLPLLPNGFSYPTTITMAFLRAGLNVAFEPVRVEPRAPGGKSHIRLLRDGGRFFLIIFRVGTLYSPLKIFAPLSALFFVLGLGYYGYTLLTMGRFTNLGALLFSTSVIVFLIGLISEQITTLQYLATASQARERE